MARRRRIFGFFKEQKNFLTFEKLEIYVKKILKGTQILMGKNESKQNMRRNGRSIWIVVLFLLIAVMLTLMLLGPVLSRLSQSDRNIIPLFYSGEREIFNKDGFSYIRDNAEPDMLTYDEKAQWQINTDVDLFKNAYANESGEITVQSLKGDKVIAPGTSHEYEFSLKNTGNISLDYTMHLDSVFTLLNRDLPMQVRLRSGDRWILGSENSWVEPEKLHEIIESGTVDVNKNVIYTFEWQWPFENEKYANLILNDINDTVIAEAAVNQDVTFKLSIKTQSEVTPGAVPVNGNGVELAQPLVLWNILSRIVFPAAIALGILIILLILFRRPIYVTGFIPAKEGDEFNLDKQKTDILSSDGRFVFKKVYTGKHRFVMGEKECSFKLKYKSKTEGIAFETKDDILEITVSRRVRAVELYMYFIESEIIVTQDKWAAIDKKRNVITPDGVKEPQDKQNTTPGGLHVNEDGYFEIMTPVTTAK